ncbi:MAG: single-stranded DNA-binding protein [Pseudoalteromonas sp.]
MARSLNQCNFIGNLGNDPEIRYMTSGAAVANLSLAVSDDYKDKQSGQNVEQTEWVRISAFGKLAEIIGEYLKKGSKIYCSGKMKTRKWQDNTGADRWTTEVIIHDMQMLDSRGGDGQQNNQAPQQQRPAQNNQQQVPQQQSAQADDFIDDIPF